MQMNRLRPFFYGLAELGPASIDIFLKVYLLIYFNQILGLSASLTSLAIGLSVLWDAILDPVIGILSDRYYQKHQNRKSILYFAVILICIVFFSLWHWTSTHPWVSLALLFIMSSILNSAISLFSIPYFAAANDLEADNELRKKWIGWRLVFFNMGSFLGLVVPAYYLTKVSDNLQAQPYLDAVSALVLITFIFTALSVFLTYYKVSVKRLNTEQSHSSESLLTLFKDQKFLQILISFFVVNCGLGLNSSLALYYYKVYLKFTEHQTQTILIGFLLIFTLSIPFWILMTRYYDKKKLIVISAALLGLFCILAFPHFKDVDFWIIFSLASGLAGFLVGISVVLEIFMSEFLKQKEDELKRSVSGQYLGLWKMSSKMSRGIAIALAGPIIEVSAGRTQLLANYFGWGIGLFFLLSAIVMAIPIREKKPS
jgi:glycoside/pentoside/hexuronide:cation symporter, GPH family